MAASSSPHLFFILILFLAQFTMKGFGILIPAYLLSQVSSASATWIPGYTAPAACLDSDGNKLGAVASETKECSEIGANILKKGGNAADSMVATVFCVGTLGMYHS
jgi:gamma-glutamyltranspeptidase/glutathione hydrolase